LLSDVGADFKALELDTLGQEGKAIRAELAEVCFESWLCLAECASVFQAQVEGSKCWVQASSA
jgi:hypothetical protein